MINIYVYFCIMDKLLFITNSPQSLDGILQEAEMEALEKEEALKAGKEAATEEGEQGTAGEKEKEAAQSAARLEGYLDGELEDTFDMYG